MSRQDKFEEATSLLRAWYFSAVRNIAQEALSEFPVKRADPEDDTSDDENAEARDEWVHETLDGHEFVIYTYKAQAALLASDSHDAMEEETGEKGTDEERAYYAMRQDVTERIQSEIDYPTPAEETKGGAS